MINDINKKQPSIKKNVRLWFRKNWTSAIWGIIVVIFMLVMVLGSIGFSINLTEIDKDKSYNFSTLLFMAAQLLTLQSGAQPDPLNWQLETARWLAPLVLSVGLIQTLLIRFRKQFQTLIVRFEKKHNIIGGFGVKGNFIFDDLINQGEVVVVIDKTLSPEDIQKIDHAGGYYLDRDLTNSDSFYGINLEKCRRVFVTCGQDIINIQIANVIKHSLENKRKDPWYISLIVVIYTLIRLAFGKTEIEKDKKLAVYIECHDPRVFEGILRNKTQFTFADFHRFNPIINGARFLFDNYFKTIPMTPNSTKKVNLVILGFNPETNALVLQLARLGHYANNLKPIVTVFDSNAKLWKEEILFRYPQILNIIDVEIFDINPDSHSARISLSELISNNERLIYIIIKNKIEEKILSIGMECRELTKGKKIPILLVLKSNDILKSMLEDDGKSEIQALSIIEIGCKTDNIYKDKLDELAKVIHEKYRNDLEKENEELVKQKKDKKVRDANKPWEDLEEHFRQGNRDQADHISIKLRTLNYETFQSENNALTKIDFKDSEIEMLAKMEHARWCANRWLEGYILAEKTDDGNTTPQKTHINLVPWDKLDDATKNYDKQPVLNMPELLWENSKINVRKKL